MKSKREFGINFRMHPTPQMDHRRNEDRQQLLLKSEMLEKKHSSDDLQSRLKTRKILGVGETDNGDIHRSKISQVLGHNDHLYVKFPRCYVIWHLIIAAVFTGSGIMNIMMTSIEDGHVIHEGKPRIQELLSVANRLYGSSLLGFAVLVWSLWRTADKALARNLMAATAISELLQFGALFSHSWYTGNWDTTIKLHIAVHLVSAVGSGYFFWAIGSSTAGLRKTPSYKDLTEQTQDESSGFDCYESHTPKSTSTSSAPDAKKKD